MSVDGKVFVTTTRRTLLAGRPACAHALSMRSRTSVSPAAISAARGGSEGGCPVTCLPFARVHGCSSSRLSLHSGSPVRTPRNAHCLMIMPCLPVTVSRRYEKR